MISRAQRPFQATSTFVLTLCFFIIAVGCMEPVDVGTAADPASPTSFQRIMGGDSHRVFELKKHLLTGLLKGEQADSDFVQGMRDKFNGVQKNHHAQDFDGLVGRYTRLVQELGGIENQLQRDMVWALFHMSEKRYIEAAEQLSGILDQAPATPKARVSLGSCFYYLGNPDRALIEFDLRSQELEQADVRTLDKLRLTDYYDSLVLYGQAALGYKEASPQQQQLALEKLNRYIELNPTSGVAEQVRIAMSELSGLLSSEGQAAGWASRLREALDKRQTTRAQKLLDEAPEGTDVHVLELARARIAIQSGDIPLGRTKLLEMSEKGPFAAERALYLGMTYLMTGEPKTAIQYWRRVEQLSPELFKEKRLGMRIQVAENMPAQ